MIFFSVAIAKINKCLKKKKNFDHSLVINFPNITHFLVQIIWKDTDNLVNPVRYLSIQQ